MSNSSEHETQCLFVEKVFIEYTLMAGINDSPEDARQLVKVMSQFPSKLNLIFITIHL